MTKIERTLWSPDTCSCQIYEFWDSHLPVEERVHWSEDIDKPFEHNGNTFPATTRCEAHKHHKDVHEHYSVVLEENHRKNKAHSVLNQGQTPIEWNWQGESPNRVLHIKGEPAGHGDKKTVESIINKELAKDNHGKVILE